jgi:phospholipid/cholesterol/gamma-HCH transport system substrate-binding protein
VIRRITKIQLVIFILITIVGVVYVGATYIGINPLESPFTVQLSLPSAGGIFTNADVTERGVVIGRVGTLHLEPGGGVLADLKINHGEKIPSTGLTAKVADLSAVGEQYVELEPGSVGAPYLTSSSPAFKGTIPVDDAVILRNIEQLFGSVNVHALSTTVTELGKSFADLGPSLQKLIDGGDQLTQAASNALPATEKLINDGKTVLDTQQKVSSELKSFAASFNDVTAELSGQDNSLRTILDNGSAASQQLKLLLQDNQASVPELLSNLDTFSQIQSVRLPELRATLELYPAIVADSFYALPVPGKDGISTARFGNVLDASQFCSTGYSSTKTRSNKPKDWGGAANLAAYCHGKNSKLDASQTDIRGSRNVPRPSGDTANVTTNTPHYGQAYPGSGAVGACGTPTCPTGKPAHKAAAKAATTAKAASDASLESSSTPVFFQPYDPKTGVLQGLDGKLYELGLSGPLAPVFGSSSYTWLLLAPTMR